MVESRGIQLRGYRRVFRIERRLFRFDRWRIPYPHGVPLRAIGYVAVLELGVIAASRLPLLGWVVTLLGPAISYLTLPLIGAWLLMQGRIDGRPPHHVIISLLRWSLGARCLAGLSPCPRQGAEVVPLEEVSVAFDARESFPVSGTIKGPAEVTFRYPAVVYAERVPLWPRGGSRQAAAARRLRVRQRRGAEPMSRGKVIRIPRGGEVVVE